MTVGERRSIKTGWNIVEIVCRLPMSTSVKIGNFNGDLALRKIRYYTQYGSNKITDMGYMFRFCSSLMAIPQLNTAQVTNMSYMLASSSFLIAIPQLNTAKVTDMGYMFQGCSSLMAIPQLNTAQVTNMSYMFQSCYSLITIPRLNTAKATNMYCMCQYCCSLAVITFTPTLTGWDGYVIGVTDCSLNHKAIVELFNSLPTIATTKNIILTGNHGVSELTEEEKAIATGKNWTLIL